MHNVTGDRDQVLQLMNNTLQKLESDNSQAGAAGIGADSDCRTPDCRGTVRLGILPTNATE